MRVKKQRRHRKSVRFYTACYGFRTPFKILCDGTFVHHLIANHIIPADQAVSNILGGPVKLFTSKCVLAELKKLGSSYSESLQAAHKLMVARCDHEMSGPADACITEIIAERNPEHFFVATQDTDLKKKFLEIPGVPVIFGLRNALFLEQPSATQRQFIRNLEEERSRMKATEYKLLKKRTKEILASEGEKVSDNENQVLEDGKLDNPPTTKRKGMEVKDKVQFKRKRAKGPNPLSCKKKKPKISDPVPKQENKDGENNASKKNRKRKRSHRKKLPEADSK